MDIFLFVCLLFVFYNGFRLWLTLYKDGFQGMGNPQQQSVWVEVQVQRHVSGDGGLRRGHEEVDGGLSGQPGAPLKKKKWD